MCLNWMIYDTHRQTIKNSTLMSYTPIHCLSSRGLTTPNVKDSSLVITHFLFKANLNSLSLQSFADIFLCVSVWLLFGFALWFWYTVDYVFMFHIHFGLCTVFVNLLHMDSGVLSHGILCHFYIGIVMILLFILFKLLHFPNCRLELS